MAKWVVVVLGVLLAPVARADADAEAWELLQRGIHLYKTADYSGARTLLLQAKALVADRVPTVHRWLGLSEAALGHCADALSELERFLASAPAPPDAAEAIAARDQCKTKLAAVSLLRVETFPPGAEVRVDPDDDPKKPPLGFSPLSLEQFPPGDHLVSVQRAGYQSASRIVTLTAGQTTVVQLTLAAVTPPPVALVIAPPAVVAAPATPVWKRRWFWPTVVGAVLVVGAVAVGVGVGVAESKQTFPTLMFQ